MIINNTSSYPVYIIYSSSKYDRRNGTHFIACIKNKAEAYKFFNSIKSEYEKYESSWCDIEEILPYSIWMEKDGQ